MISISGRAVCELRAGLPPAPFHLPQKPGLGLATYAGSAQRGLSRFSGWLGGFLILKAVVALVYQLLKSQRVGRDSRDQQSID